MDLDHELEDAEIVTVPAEYDPYQALAADVILGAVRIAAATDPDAKVAIGASVRRRLIDERAAAVEFLQGRELHRWLLMAGYQPREIPEVAELIRRWRCRPRYRAAAEPSPLE